MNDKLNRINRFIESLPNGIETSDATLALLPTSMELNGAGTNFKVCTNFNLDVCKPPTNTECGNPYNGLGCNSGCQIGTNTQKGC